MRETEREDNKMEKQIVMLPGECWWGGVVNLGYLMPLTRQSVITLEPGEGRENDQFSPVYVSSKGRYFFSKKPFVLRAENGVMNINGYDEIVLREGYMNLRGAYEAASRECFPFDGRMPDETFFTTPQYNTWIELGTDQTSENILRYAKEILAHGLPAGILMIDGGWQEDYGSYTFHKGKIPDPAKLIYELHQMGFKVMVWVSPIAACAGTRYKLLRDRGYLLRDKNGEIAIRRWWSGFSAVLDFSNPEAVKWYHGELRELMDCYGVDGFKFDAGDKYFYADDDMSYEPMLALEQTEMFNRVGMEYALNEFRAAWNFGGKPIVARLHDKYHSWDDHGINTLIPHTLMQGLLGYAYCCPDMVGGGIISCFSEDKKLDEELFVRWAQANALMGMMQMSVSPWRVLSEGNTALVLEAMQLHAAMGGTMLELAKYAARTGEPIVRAMDYVFPNEGLECVTDQFMLGDNLLAAPIIQKGAATRTVRLPKGTWIGWDGKTYNGGQSVSLHVTMKDIPHFTRKA